MPPAETSPRRVSIVSLGCSRNDVDSEELAGRLAAEGWQLVADPEDADVAVVNTCGFVEQAKQDSINVLLEAAALKDSGRTQAVVAVGCLAERYGQQLADELPEADAVLGFDSYAGLSTHLTTVLRGGRVASHVPHDRRTLLPISPVDRAFVDVALPGHGTGPMAGPASGPRFIRARLDGRPWAPLKIASGCDRRCAFCAIPAFRGAFVSRPVADVVAEGRWLADQGVRELFLVSENSTSYGKDLGDLGLMEKLLPQLADIDGVQRIRVSYLQPAEVRPQLLDAMADTPKVVPYYDVSFQHAAPGLLRRMRRFGDTRSFLDLLDAIRHRSPLAGIRSNVIVGFPGETEDDVEDLEQFLGGARLDVVGVFGYSDEDGTEAQTYAGKLDPDVIAERVERLTELVEHLTSERARERIGEHVEVLVEEVDDGVVIGRAAFQGPEVDGVTIVRTDRVHAVGDLVAATVVDTEGVDLLAEPA